MSKLFGSVSVCQKNDFLKRPNVIARTCERWELVLGVNGEAISKELLGPPKELNPVTDQPSLICELNGVLVVNLMLLLLDGWCNRDFTPTIGDQPDHR
jgi:hypothetical protein